MLSLALLGLYAYLSRTSDGAHIASNMELVRRLKLTDLCLFTEARYTRNPAMADLHAPFQDHPMALEHFPSGSLMAPPDFVREKR